MLATAADAPSIIAIDCGLLLGLLVMGWLLDRDRTLDRILFGATVGILIALYFYWRWHDTLPALAPTAGSAWAHLFIGFEAIAILYTLMSILILTRRADHSSAADAAQAALTRADAWPRVDVFICTYDEPLEIVERSILSALALDYATATVYVLDDTRRTWLRDYCAEVGAQYLTRPDNNGAKAGNLNNALKATAALTNAPLILVLDADFAPRRDFLRRVVGLFADDAVGVVQTPQFYYNADTIQHNLLASTTLVDDQRFFFDVFQPAKDAWGCAFCVGTSFVVRRDRLNALSGFPTEAISEDINLTYRLMSRGFRTLWLNEPLSFGLSAEGVPEYITQRARWCLGTLQVALLRDGPLLGRGYNFTQRWHYLHGVLNWLCKPFLVLMLLAPSIYWFAGVPAFEADYLSFLRYGLPALLAQMVYMHWISRARAPVLFMEAAHTVTCFAITATLISAAIKPFGRPFKVTDKGGDRSQPRVHRKLATAFGAIAASSAAAIVWAFISPNAASEVSSLDYFNLVWAGIAMLIAFIAFVVCFELPRTEEIFGVSEEGWLAAGDRELPCWINTLSLRAASVTLPAGTACPAGPARLHVPSLGWIDVTLAAGVSRHRVVARLAPSPAQRRQLVVRLFSRPNPHVAGEARLASAFVSLARRGLWGR